MEKRKEKWKVRKEEKNGERRESGKEKWKTLKNGR